MSKKTQTAATVQASASTDEATVGQSGATVQASAQDGATTEQPLEQVRGRALVDLPAHSLKCGEFGDLPAAIAQSLAAAGEFDPKAVEA
jgi:hypothetical protein